MTPTLSALLATAALLGVYLWQDGIRDCPDGKRYTSGIAQPYPFHRRWCGWSERALVITSLGSLLALGALMGDWKHALVFGSLPGFWLVATRPTSVDGPAMLLALSASLLWSVSPYAAIACSCLAGFIHERGPVFAALYAWNPILLVGLVAVGWWRKPAEADGDIRVGRGLRWALHIHRQDHDWLSWEQTLFALRGLPLFAAGYGATPGAWMTLGFAWASRLVGSDLGRFAFWGAPILVRDLPELPVWMVLLHTVTFRRMA